MKARFEKRRLRRAECLVARAGKRMGGCHWRWEVEAWLRILREETRRDFGGEYVSYTQESARYTADALVSRLIADGIIHREARNVRVTRLGVEYEVTLPGVIAGEMPIDVGFSETEDHPNENGPPAPLPGGPDQQGN